MEVDREFVFALAQIGVLEFRSQLAPTLRRPGRERPGQGERWKQPLESTADERNLRFEGCEAMQEPGPAAQSGGGVGPGAVHDGSGKLHRREADAERACRNERTARLPA
jgi:hypothetical protein